MIESVISDGDVAEASIPTGPHFTHNQTRPKLN